MTLRLSLIACALAACSSKPTSEAPTSPTPPTSSPLDAAPASPSISGTYRTNKTVNVVCDKPDWCEQAVTDVLRVTESGDDVVVKIELVQANAHTCGFEGTLKATASPAPGTRRWEHKVEGDEACHLTLDRTETEMSIGSEGCRQWCGARAYLMASFEATPDDPDPLAYSCEERCKSLVTCSVETKAAPALEDVDCRSACWNKKAAEQDTFDDCVRNASDDCNTMLECL